MIIRYGNNYISVCVKLCEIQQRYLRQFYIKIRNYHKCSTKWREGWSLERGLKMLKITLYSIQIIL